MFSIAETFDLFSHARSIVVQLINCSKRTGQVLSSFFFSFLFFFHFCRYRSLNVVIVWQRYADNDFLIWFLFLFFLFSFFHFFPRQRNEFCTEFIRSVTFKAQISIYLNVVKEYSIKQVCIVKADIPWAFTTNPSRARPNSSGKFIYSLRARLLRRQLNFQT